MDVVIAEDIGRRKGFARSDSVAAPKPKPRGPGIAATAGAAARAIQRAVTPRTEMSKEENQDAKRRGEDAYRAAARTRAVRGKK
jgi:hypothetical protein